MLALAQNVFREKRYEPQCIFQQCVIFTSVDTDELIGLLLSLETPNAIRQ